MKKYKIYKRPDHYLLCELKYIIWVDGWYPKLLSRHESREEANKEIKKLKEREVNNNERNG